MAKVQFNPSTGKVKFNPNTGKVMMAKAPFCPCVLTNDCPHCFPENETPANLAVTFMGVKKCSDDSLLELNGHEICLAYGADEHWLDESERICGWGGLRGDNTVDYGIYTGDGGETYISALVIISVTDDAYFMGFGEDCGTAFDNYNKTFCGNYIAGPLGSIIGYDGTGTIENPCA